MDIETKFWHLFQFKLSRRLNRSEMMYMCNAMVMKRFKKGVPVELENSVTKNVYFLKSGTVKIVTLCNNGEELIKDIVKKGDIFGLMGLVHLENDNDYAVAMEDADICIIEVEFLKKMMAENANLNNHILKLTGLKIKKLERRLESLIYKDSKTRIVEFIIDYLEEHGAESESFIVADFLLSNKDIAKLTSTSRQTVSTTLNFLKKHNHLVLNNKILKIKLENFRRKSLIKS